MAYWAQGHVPVQPAAFVQWHDALGFGFTAVGMSRLSSNWVSNCRISVSTSSSAGP
ncbi:hypothetical protein [Kitasatospora aureofaciens]|uniref:hypothetical protein n=1 Tax=Kitasatospora aureofaciens TaxID=1894 RepID=UPI0036F4A056